MAESSCKYCDRRGIFPGEGRQLYCILHSPDPNSKDRAQFEKEISSLSQVEYWLKNVCFPQGHANFNRKTFSGIADFRGVVGTNRLSLGDLRTNDGCIQHIELSNATVTGTVELKSMSLQRFIARHAKFQRDVNIEYASATFDLSSEFQGNLRLRCSGAICTFAPKALIHGVLDLGDCTFTNGPIFSGTIFGESSAINLSHAQIGQLEIALSDTQPRSVTLDGTVLRQNTIFKKSGGQPLVLRATETPPTIIEGTATFSNVDLSECLLVGTNLEALRFYNVTWGKRHGRRVLYDEVALRQGKDLNPRDIKEAYQTLKQVFQTTKGDNFRAGEFHYGEMEMKRREYSRFRRYFCPEFLYWLLSGYGHAWRRAFGWLIVLIVAFAFAYMWAADDLPFSFLRVVPHKYQLRVIATDFLDAVNYSLQVTSLFQRPVADPTNRSLRWVQVIQTLVMPIQIALLILALRMRLKR